jgi:hypothetical protein
VQSLDHLLIIASVDLAPMHQVRSDQVKDLAKSEDAFLLAPLPQEFAKLRPIVGVSHRKAV